MATLLLDIKRIVVQEAVKRAQESVVRNIAEVTGSGVESNIEVVAQDITGGQGGGTVKQIPKSYPSCGGICQNSEVEVQMAIDQSQMFERDRAGSNMEGYKHHGLGPRGTKWGQGGGAIKKILKSEFLCGEYYSEQGDEQHHEHEFYGTNEVSGEFQDKETMLGDSKEQKSQNVKEDDIYQLSGKSVSDMISTSIVGNFSKPEEKVAVEDTNKNDEVPPNTEQPRMMLTSDYLSVEQYQARQQASKTGEMQPESRAVVSDSLSKFPEPEKLDPPDRLTIPSVCRTEDEAQYVPPVQHSLEAEDLAEAQCVHHVLDADQALAAEDEAQHIPPAQHSLKAGDQDLAQAQVPGHQTDPDHYIAQDLTQAQVPGSQAIMGLAQAQVPGHQTDPDHHSNPVPAGHHSDPVPAEHPSNPVPAEHYSNP